MTKQATPVKANGSGSALEIEADTLHKATEKAKTAKEAADVATKDAQAKGAGTGATHRLTTAYDIPDYINEAGKSVSARTIATSADLKPIDLVDIAGAAVAMGKAHAAAEKEENLFQAKNSTGGGVMNMQLADKDLAMKADKKLSDVIDAYGAFRATLGANQNRLQSSSNNLDNMISNTAQALGSIKDTDFADEMKNHAQSEMLMQSSVMMLKKANAATQLISTLLQG